MSEEIEIRVPVQENKPESSMILMQIWRELTAGIGFWGTLRPLVAALIAVIPFLFLGQHFNRQHQKAFDWTLLQFPLALTVILWLLLWFWSIFDAWREASKIVSEKSGLMKRGFDLLQG
jgi:hypothetical protein